MSGAASSRSWRRGSLDSHHPSCESSVYPNTDARRQNRRTESQSVARASGRGQDAGSACVPRIASLGQGGRKRRLFGNGSRRRANRRAITRLQTLAKSASALTARPTAHGLCRIFATASAKRDLDRVRTPVRFNSRPQRSGAGCDQPTD
jgi:hypothetical protein